MTNKSTKKALLLSILSMFVCLAMLVGTTFAWFTDSVTSGKNTITAGNLDIELEYSKDMTSWASVDGKSDLINPEALWEPGHTEVVYLKVTNLGTLALKYNFSMNVADTVIGKSVLGNDINLSEYLKYDVVDVTAVFADRDEAREAVEDTAKALAAYTVDGTMTEKGESKTFALVVYMPEEVGNEANYRGEKIPTIELGLELKATQLTSEKDFFDDQYDKFADYDGEISNGASFAAALNKGGIYKVTSDITLDAYVTVPAGVTVALDLNGKTISAASGNVIRNNGNLTVANGTLQGTTTYTINNESATGSVTVENVKSLNGGFYNAGSMVVNNCEITNTASGKHALYNAGTLVVNGGTYSTTAGNAILYSGNGTIEVNDGSFTQIGSSYIIDGAVVTINGGTFTDDDGKWAIRGTHTILGGTFNFDPSAYIADGYVATKNADGTYTVAKKVVPDGTTLVSEGLYVDADGVYYITNATGLATMGTMVADEDTYDSDGTWILYTDVDMTGVEWTPVNGFHGTFDGNGKTISNLTVSTDDAAGLFGKNNLNGDGTATKPVIMNLTVSNASITGNEGVAVVAGNIGYADIEKVTVIGATVNGNKYVGGIIGTAYTTGGVVISECSVVESTIKAEGANANGKVGGIGGFVANGTVTGNNVENCTISGPECVGGIVGRGGSGETVAVIYGNTVSGNTVSGTDTATVGDIIGDKLNVKESE